jgi:sugar/nucleoside kinase (ribokinase family)
MSDQGGRCGVLAAGNWVIDKVKIIDHFPQEDGLALVLEERAANGGAPYNVLKDLARLQAPFPLAGLGLVGEDPDGDSVLEDCRIHKIDTKALVRVDCPTSYTDVMSVQSTGRRTFFHQKGANALLSREHFDFTDSRARIFHLGYLLLLDRLDELDATGRTGASYVLEDAVRMGLQTACDVVSASGDRFGEVVRPSLPFVDFLVINEYEAARITGRDLGGGGEVDVVEAAGAAADLIAAGVRQWAVIHFPAGAVAAGAQGRTLYHPSAAIPAGKVRGAVGAGDAFAAGLLFGLHEGWPIERCLRLASGAAAACLFDPSASDGVRSAEECLALVEEFGLRAVPAEAARFA